MDKYEGIEVFNVPIEVEVSKWAAEHPDCDTIMEHDVDMDHMKVFAYSIAESWNVNLAKYRDEFMDGKAILKGLSRYAISGLV